MRGGEGNGGEVREGGERLSFVANLPWCPNPPSPSPNFP